MTREELVREGLDSLDTARRFLGISRSGLYVLMKTGRIPHIKIGRLRRIPHKALLKFAAENLIGAGGDSAAAGAF